MTARPAGLTPLLFGLGCVVWIREPEAYREEVVELVESRSDLMQTCYDDVLIRRQLEIESEERAAAGPYEDIGPAVSARVATIQGHVAVQVVVAAETGRISAEIDPTLTTAPPEVLPCVQSSLANLELSPPDERTGTLALAFTFKPGKRRGTRPHAGDPLAPTFD